MYFFKFFCNEKSVENFVATEQKGNGGSIGSLIFPSPTTASVENRDRGKIQKEKNENTKKHRKQKLQRHSFSIVFDTPHRIHTCLWERQWAKAQSTTLSHTLCRCGCVSFLFPLPDRESGSFLPVLCSIPSGTSSFSFFLLICFCRFIPIYRSFNISISSFCFTKSELWSYVLQIVPRQWDGVWEEYIKLIEKVQRSGWCFRVSCDSWLYLSSTLLVIECRRETDGLLRGF